MTSTGGDGKLGSEQLLILRKTASAALQRSWSPYSCYPVGAALLTASGQIVSGCNVENAAYPSGLCAEASAIGSLVSSLGAQPLLAVYVICQGEEAAWPCGSCRQRLNEFAHPDLWVYTSTWDGAVQSCAFSNLFPHSFGPQNLGLRTLGA
ncbi:cytidine deaminase [Acidithiobacillus sp. IBUN Pt1247-S3]|uniref:cytidine deaminase n=1 Tax=Acidithiobacillus sp. IBUN Pt1247-S3 TaxID=3166642 RepID=UPI0034E39072